MAAGFGLYLASSSLRCFQGNLELLSSAIPRQPKWFVGNTHLSEQGCIIHRTKTDQLLPQMYLSRERTVTSDLLAIQPLPGAKRYVAGIKPRCEECGMTSSLYINLIDGKILCARIPSGKGHSLKNYEKNTKHHTALNLDSVTFTTRRVKLRSEAQLSCWNYQHNEWVTHGKAVNEKIDSLLLYWFPSHVPSLRFQCAKFIQKEIPKFAAGVSSSVPLELREYIQHLPPYESPPE